MESLSGCKSEVLWIAMANPDHLTQLELGVEGWNSFRTVNRNINPDLRGIELIGKDLTGVNFRLGSTH